MPAAGVPWTAAGAPGASASSTATYGSRSASAIVSTITGSTWVGAIASPSRRPSVEIAAYGSSRCPCSSRLTPRWSRSRSGWKATATSPVAESAIPNSTSWPSGAGHAEHGRDVETAQHEGGRRRRPARG